MTVITFIL